MVRQGSSKSFCSMKPTVAFGPSTGTPLSRMRPSLGRSKPATRLRIVLLPQPEGPTTATNSPRRTSKVTRSIAVTADTPSGAVNRLVTARRSSTDAVLVIVGIQCAPHDGKFLLEHRRRPRLRDARRPFHTRALECPGNLLEILLTGAEDCFQGIGQGLLLGRQHAPARLVFEPGMEIAHPALPCSPILNFQFV